MTTKPWSLAECCRHFSAAGVRRITIWRDKLEGAPLAESARLVRESGLSVTSVCRGGFFPSVDPAKRREAIDDNRRAIDEAAELQAPVLVLVCGADPAQPLAESRRQIRDGIAATLDHAAIAGVRLAIEPLHPMYAGDRSAINTLRQATDMAEELRSPWVGVAIDVYHVWWDPDLEMEIARCGRLGRLFAYHVCDWKTPTTDMLLDRGLMGEGCIPLRQIGQWIDAAGFTGPREVEIFSESYWRLDQRVYLQQIIQAYQTHCA